MGKSQYKKKTAQKRHNPIRVPDSHLGGGKGEGKADPAKEQQMLPVLNKLKSPDYAERTWACAAICNLIQNDAATRRLFQGRNVVGELIERLSDSVDEVIVEASGALRNLAIDGGHELCGEMFNKGIMSHLIVLIGKISSTISSILTPSAIPPKFSDTEVQARKHLLALAENVISLLWSLAETSHKTLQAVNAAGCESLLIEVMGGREIMGLGATLAAAQALYSLSQDNPPFRQAILRHPTALQTLLAVCRTDHQAAESSANGRPNGKGKAKSETENGEDGDLGDGRALLSRILVAGALRNLVEAGSAVDEVVGIQALTNETILPLINGLLDVNLENVSHRVLQLAGEAPQQVILPAQAKGLKTDYVSPADRQLACIERMLMTVVIGLEVLTGICAGLEDTDEEVVEDAETSADDEDEEMDDAIPDEELIEMGRDPAEDIEPIASLPITHTATLTHLLTTLLLPQRLTTLALPTTLSFPPSANQPSPHPPTTTVLSILHLRSLEALNNLLLTTAASLPADTSAASQITGFIPSQGVWDGMFRIIEAVGADAEALMARGQEMRLEVIEMALGSLWGVAKIAVNQVTVIPQQIQTLITAIQVVKTDKARTQTIETLSSIAIRPSVTVEENRIIGTYLLTELASALPPKTLASELIVAVLNAIIDIYADEGREFDTPVFVQGGFLQALTGVVGRVRNDVRRIDKRKQPALRDRAEETYENLVAFIKYRRSLRR